MNKSGSRDVIDGDQISNKFAQILIIKTHLQRVAQKSC